MRASVRAIGLGLVHSVCLATAVTHGICERCWARCSGEWRQWLSMLNWRRDPGYEPRKMQHEQRKMQHEQRM